MDKIQWGRSKSVADYDQAKFREFFALPAEEIKRACCDDSGKLVHIIKADHFDLPFLDKICETAYAARSIARVDDLFLRSSLSSRSALNYFRQPSTRTLLSFSMAEAHLGMIGKEVTDITTSSIAKGETEKDSLRTSSSYFDAIICRHPSDLYDLFGVWVMNSSDRRIPFINAGSGTKEHPTQGILDYYTLKESFPEGLEGITIAYVGDCQRGRTVHSLAKIMALHQKSTAYFVAPDDNLQIDAETEQYIRSRGTEVHKINHPLREIVPYVDAVYMTRIQDEHGGQGEYNSDFIFTEEMLDLMREKAILMHPMPKREEVDPALDYIKGNKHIAYWKQQRNGMWTRVALLAHVFGVDDRIRDRYEQIKQH